MSGEPENFVLVYLRRLDEKMDRVVSELQDLKQRVTSLEITAARTRQDVAELSASLAGMQVRMDRIDGRLDRIERRPDLAEAHT